MVWKDGCIVLLGNQEGRSAASSDAGAPKAVFSEAERERLRHQLQEIANLLTSGEITQEWKGFKQLMRLKDDLIMLFAAAPREEEPDKTMGGSGTSGL
jgi:hypothetical protein